MRNKRDNYTKEMNDFILKNYLKYSIDEFVELFNKKFDNNRTKAGLLRKAADLGLRRKIKTNFTTDVESVKKKISNKKYINGFELVKFYKNFALFEKKYKSGEINRVTYTYWELERIL